jgi:SAM-dependent methyltransferase
LEIGCGPGLFLERTRGFFSYRVGLDFSEFALDSAKNWADKVVCGGVNRLEDGEEFDLIVGISVLEHIYDPHGFMCDVMAHLKNDGAALFVVPDFGGVWHRMLGVKWPSFKVPEHVVFFTVRGLRLLGDRHGLKSSFFSFTQCAPLSLILGCLGIKCFTEGKVTGVEIPIPHAMRAVLYEKREL